MTTKLTIAAVQDALRALGYYDGPTDSDYMSENFRADLKRFQADSGLEDDGWYGPNTEGKLLPLANALAHAPPGFTQCRRWRMTVYNVGDVASYGPGHIPMKTPTGQLIANVAPGAFAEAALEGTTKLPDGRLVGVAHPAYSPCDPHVFSPVYDIAKRNGWVPEKPGYAGILLSSDKTKAAQSRNFAVKHGGPKGWPVEAKGIECDPFFTVAADNGRLPKHDPAFKGKGGVVPAGTKVWILELWGRVLPDGRTHTGWVTVNDTGGGIYGAHFDLFTGSRAWGRALKMPGRAHIWFSGIETRLPMDYSYGI